MSLIKNKDDLIKHYDQIINLIYNQAGMYANDAILLFNIFYGSRVLKIDIKDIHKYKEFFYTETIIPEDVIIPMKNYVDILYLVKDEYDIIGNFYEFCIGKTHKRYGGKYSKSSKMGDLGQYYTDKKIVDILVNKFELDYSKSFCDPFCGSGGFIKKYISSNKDGNICGVEIDEKTVKTARLSLYTITNKNCVISGDSFKSDALDGRTFDYIFTNPPYGGDRILISDCNNIIKKVAIDIGIPNNKLCNKESLSLLLCIGLLAKKGMYVGVLKEGVFFDGKFSKLREYIATKYNIENVISIPSDVFTNTSIKTSVLVFSNTGITQSVKFSEFIKKDNQFVEVNPITKSPITDDDSYFSVNMKDLAVKNFSLIYKEYKKQDQINIEEAVNQFISQSEHVIELNKTIQQVIKEKIEMYKKFNFDTSVHEKMLKLLEDGISIDEDQIKSFQSNLTGDQIKII